MRPRRANFYCATSPTGHGLWPFSIETPCSTSSRMSPHTNTGGLAVLRLRRPGTEPYSHMLAGYLCRRIRLPPPSSASSLQQRRTAKSSGPGGHLQRIRDPRMMHTVKVLLSVTSAEQADADRIDARSTQRHDVLEYRRESVPRPLGSKDKSCLARYHGKYCKHM